MSAREPLEAITLDAAGTLMRVAEPVAETYARIAADAGAHLEPGALSAAFAEEFPRMPPMAFARRSGPALVEAEREWWRRLVARVVTRAGGVDAFETYFDALYRHYADASAWRVYAEVPDALDLARARGLRLAVVSNFDSRLPAILRGLGIAERFEAVVYSSACGAAKPEAGIFEHALEALGAPPLAAVHVGDDLEADYRGAAAAGMRALLVKRHGPPPAGVATLRHLGELAHVLGRLP